MWIDVLATAVYHAQKVAALADLDLSYTPQLSSPLDPLQGAAHARVAHQLVGPVASSAIPSRIESKLMGSVWPKASQSSGTGLPRRSCEPWAGGVPCRGWARRSEGMALI